MTVLCECGCGGRAPIATRTRPERGLKKGEPQRFIRGHATRDGALLASIEPPNPSGICLCGCGLPTSIATYSHARCGIVKGHHHRYRPGHARRVNPDTNYVVVGDCWIWQSALNADGYGCLIQDGKWHRAHRWFWERANGPVPTGLVIDHLCRMPACVNPAHLEPVTNAENIRRGTGTRLSAADAQGIREAVGTHGDVARRFGITREHAWRIRTGRAWVVV